MRSITALSASAVDGRRCSATKVISNRDGNRDPTLQRGAQGVLDRDGPSRCCRHWREPFGARPLSVDRSIRAPPDVRWATAESVSETVTAAVWLLRERSV